MAKRNCRRTPEERAIHDRAVTLRKMTDRQLVEYADRKTAPPKPSGPTGEQNVERIILSLKTTKGIGAATVAKVEAIVRRYLCDE
ncbi:MAG: hypothetical protein FWB91_00250 [Defluviitaleaceae bacterium]|nr:hypothetical protein [Defluviitaleaceae bacterium]